MGQYLVGIDIGGTFTDCVVLDRKGGIIATKASSTPGNFAEGMLAAMRVAALRLDLSFEQFCRDINVLTHGTTVGTNALIQRKGAKVGLITTKGHEDAIHIMRGSRGFTSRDLNKVVYFPETRKPVAIVPKRLILVVSERVDCFGAVVVPLNEGEVEAAVRRLVEQDVEAIGRMATQLGLTLEEAASGIAKIAEFKMADIIRKMTVEKGYDPRDFALFAFGGASAGGSRACVPAPGRSGFPRPDPRSPLLDQGPIPPQAPAW